MDARGWQGVAGAAQVLGTAGRIACATILGHVVDRKEGSASEAGSEHADEGEVVRCRDIARDGRIMSVATKPRRVAHAAI